MSLVDSFVHGLAERFDMWIQKVEESFGSSKGIRGRRRHSREREKDCQSSQAPRRTNSAKSHPRDSRSRQRSPDWHSQARGNSKAESALLWWYPYDRSTHYDTCRTCVATGYERPFETKLRCYDSPSKHSPGGTLKSSLAEALCWPCGWQLVKQGNARARRGLRASDRTPSSRSGSGSRGESRVRFDEVPRGRSSSYSRRSKAPRSPSLLPREADKPAPDTPSIRVSHHGSRSRSSSATGVDNEARRYRSWEGSGSGSPVFTNDMPPPPSEQRRSSQHLTDDKWREWTHSKDERSRPDPHIRPGQLNNRSSTFSHREDPFPISSQPLRARSPDRDGWQASNRYYDDQSPRRRSFHPDSLSPLVPSHSGDPSYRRRTGHLRTRSEPNRWTQGYPD